MTVNIDKNELSRLHGFDCFSEYNRDHHAFRICISGQLILVFLFKSQRYIGPVHIKITFIGIILYLRKNRLYSYN